MLTQDQLLGLDTSHLVALPEDLSSKPEQFIHKDVLAPLITFADRAKADGYAFKVISSYRSYGDQKQIWNHKFTGNRAVYDIDEKIVDVDNLDELSKIKAIMLFSALPGASRHHWGTDFDIFPALPINDGYEVQLQVSEFKGQGVASKFNHYLEDTLPKSDFFRPYEYYQNGVAEEPWHLSYKHLASECLINLDENMLSRQIHFDHTLAGNQTISENLSSLYTQFISNICDGR